jgi:hypothetical protein
LPERRLCVASSGEPADAASPAPADLSAWAVGMETMTESLETKVARLELQVHELEQLVAMHQAALMKAGEFIRIVGEAAIEANRPEE